MKGKQLCAGLMSGLLCLNLLPVQVLASGGGVPSVTEAQTQAADLSIRTAADLLALSEACTLDSWSAGKTILLENDLDLSGADFAPIPSFRGTFDGQGHTITGLSIGGKGSRKGLFRVIRAGGRVENLSIQGKVTPEGSKSSLGLLAGENAGAIVNCEAIGTVEGRNEVGGLVGLNTGVLEQCRAGVTVTGQQNVGGICGSSSGVISGCTARGAVNTAVPNARIADPLLNTGGVVGESTGVIRNCMNYAQVGYPHVGYNVGGIAGSHEGSLTGCSNSGEILGRKGVGGIVGRFTPELDIFYSDDPVEKLNNALSALSASFFTLSDQVADTVDRGVDRVEGLNEELDALRDTTSGTIDRQTELAREACDTIHEKLQAINTAAGDIHSAFEPFSDSTNQEIDDVLDDLNDLQESIVNNLGVLGDAANHSASSAQNHLKNIENAGYLNKIRTESGALTEDMGKLNQFLVKALLILSDGNIADTDRRAELVQAGIDSGVLDTEEKLTIHPEQHLMKLQKAQTELEKETLALLLDVSNIVAEAHPDAYNTREAIRDAGNALDRDAGKLNKTCKGFSDKVNNKLKAINGDLAIIEDTLKRWGDDADAEGDSASDQINGHLDAIENQIDGMTQGVDDSNQQIHRTTDTIIAQLDQVRQAAYDMTKKPTYTLDDRSVLGPGERGFVTDSISSASIDGDANVGGVVGIVSFVVSEDPEEELDWDWEEDHPLLADVTAQVRGTVSGCRNSGAVNAKNESVGGIVGRLDVGAVLDSVNYGNVFAEGGAYCGGIAGYCDKSAVAGCAARCVLTAQDQVGGITGTGGDISNCRAMVTVEADGEELGSISGQTEGALTGSYALREGLGAVDGTDLDGQAQTLDYPEFSALTDLPDDFLRFELTFVADGETVAVLPFDYNGGIDESLIPPVPRKDSCYARWEDFPTLGLRRSRVIQAIYTPWDTTASSGGSRPAILAEGSFSPEASIAVEPFSGIEAPWDRKVCDGWRYAITDPDRPVQDRVELRVLAQSGGDRAAAALVTEQGLVLIRDAEREGSYLTFEAPAAGQVVILTGSVVPILCLAGGGVLLAAGVTALIIRRKRRKKAAAAAASESPAEPEDKT